MRTRGSLVEGETRGGEAHGGKTESMKAKARCQVAPRSVAGTGDYWKMAGPSFAARRIV